MRLQAMSTACLIFPGARDAQIGSTSSEPVGGSERSHEVDGLERMDLQALAIPESSYVRDQKDRSWRSLIHQQNLARSKKCLRSRNTGREREVLMKVTEDEQRKNRHRKMEFSSRVDLHQAAAAQED